MPHVDPDRAFREWMAHMLGDRARVVLDRAAGKTELRLPDNPDMFDSVRPGARHGTYMAWKYGCRCAPCRAHKRAERADYYARKRA